ncbi:MAG: undecaprenyldiphospho-muramoylpentapeptide beta-N-acetylglucosaminyltransferase [bacterium]|nr:undecaprenyldiphospho-muramoylpentapeptide beta-N-acetylglucosaminyltransferase [bacterium]
MRVVLAGGGSGGATVPLLAVADEIRRNNPQAKFIFIGTTDGPERQLVHEAKIVFRSVTAGKLRRYWSWQNFIDPLRVLLGFFQSLYYLHAFGADAVLSVGGYVSVPVVWAARLMEIPSHVHQQDVEPGLANRLLTWPATRMSVTFKHSLKFFPGHKTLHTGNPVRSDIMAGSKERGMNAFSLDPKLPTVLVFGGGTGAQKINELMVGAAFELCEHLQVIHIFGKTRQRFNIANSRYHAYEFLSSEMADAYAVADIVVCRAGLSTISELSALSKSAIIIPMPETHQEANAALLKRSNAAVIVDQGTLTSDFLIDVILGLLANAEWREILKKNIHALTNTEARSSIAQSIINLAKAS